MSAAHQLGAVGSRTADDLFWFGRYMERIDSGIRQLRATVSRLIRGAPGPRDVIVEIKASGMCGSDLKVYRAAAASASLGLGKASGPVIAGVSALAPRT